MKTLRNILSYALVISMCAFFFTSCDDDSMIGSTLARIDGRWFGDMDMYVNGQKARGTDIQFTATNYYGTRGWGVEYDYYGHYGTMTIRHDFNWEVVNGIIYLTYDDPALDCSIRQYSLNDRRFTGWLDGYETSTYFELYSYNYYWDDYGYASYDDGYVWNDFYYYVKGQDGTARKDTTVACTRGVNVKKEEAKSEE